MDNNALITTAAITGIIAVLTMVSVNRLGKVSAGRIRMVLYVAIAIQEQFVVVVAL